MKFVLCYLYYCEEPIKHPYKHNKKHWFCRLMLTRPTIEHTGGNRRNASLGMRVWCQLSAPPQIWNQTQKKNKITKLYISFLLFSRNHKINERCKNKMRWMEQTMWLFWQYLNSSTEISTYCINNTISALVCPFTVCVCVCCRWTNGRVNVNTVQPLVSR